MKLGIDGKLCLVTGGTMGIGRGIAEVLVAEGVNVLINGRNPKTTQEAVDSINSMNLGPGKVVGGIAADVSTAEGAADAIEQVAKYGEIDFLVNNVGIFEVKNFEDITDDDWEKYFQVNIMSCVRLCRHYLPKMLARNSGKIIVIASESGFKPLGTMIHYSMTKGSLINLARGMAETTKGTKVTVNSVLPGPTATEGLTNYFEGIAKKDNQPVDKVIKEYFQREEPASLIQRLVTTQEVGSTTAFLLSPLAGAINGSSQRCEGGVYRST